MKAILALLLLYAATGIATSNAEEMSQLVKRIGFDQNLGQQLSLDLPFRDENGKEVKLGDFFGSRPVLVMLVYYRCPGICTAAADGIIRCLRAMTQEPGRDFEIVMVSIDPHETPEMATAKRNIYIEEYDRPGATAHWHCLTGPQVSIDTLAKESGFRYVYDKETNQFSHASGMMVLSPSGKISRYFFSTEYYPLDLRLALAESAENRTGSIQDKALLLCMRYDPATGRYGFAIINLLRLGAVLTVAALATFIGMNLRREAVRKAATPGRLDA